jgi:hypothetical protein
MKRKAMFNVKEADQTNFQDLLPSRSNILFCMRSTKINNHSDNHNEENMRKPNNSHANGKFDDGKVPHMHKEIISNSIYTSSVQLSALPNNECQGTIGVMH